VCAFVSHCVLCNSIVIGFALVWHRILCNCDWFYVAKHIYTEFDYMNVLRHIMLIKGTVVLCTY